MDHTPSFLPAGRDDFAPVLCDFYMQVLDLLDEYDAKATFFVIAGHFEGKEHLVRECVQV